MQDPRGPPDHRVFQEETVEMVGIVPRATVREVHQLLFLLQNLPAPDLSPLPHKGPQLEGKFIMIQAIPLWCKSDFVHGRLIFPRLK